MITLILSDIAEKYLCSATLPANLAAWLYILGDVLEQANFVVTILPLTKKTIQLFTKEKLALMKPSAILINDACEKLLINKHRLKY